MGFLADFLEVIKGLKCKKRGEVTVNVCPKCGSPKILLSSSFDTYPRMYGITPRKYVCQECGYSGSIVMEQTKEETG
jgi:ssDNA-binding Zn-finger/Zn-ribbon topoisomerase 1